LVGSYTDPGELDSVFYFPQKFQVFDDVFGRGGPTSKIQDLRTARAANYGATPQTMGIGVPPQQALVNFMDNHDVSRFLWAQPSRPALRAALAYLLTEDGIPCIYYGTEQDFDGGNDPSNREPLWWSGYERSGVTFQWVAQLTRQRHRYAALRRGDMTLTWTTERVGDAEDAGALAFERKTADGGYALVAINAQGAHASHTSFGGTAMSVTSPAGTVLVDVLSGDTLTVAADGTLNVELEPYQARILIPETQVVSD